MKKAITLPKLKQLIKNLDINLIDYTNAGSYHEYPPPDTGAYFYAYDNVIVYHPMAIQMNNVAFDTRHVLLHELGHALGLKTKRYAIVKVSKYKLGVWSPTPTERAFAQEEFIANEFMYQFGKKLGFPIEKLKLVKKLLDEAVADECWDFKKPDTKKVKTEVKKMLTYVEKNVKLQMMTFKKLKEGLNVKDTWYGKGIVKKLLKTRVDIYLVALGETWRYDVQHVEHFIEIDSKKRKKGK